MVNKLIQIWLLIINSIAVLKGLVLNVYVHNATKSGVCCPMSKLSHEICGGPERGVCAHMEYPNEAVPEIFKFDERVEWPKRFFHSVCHCKGNFHGIACEECWYGWSGQECNKCKLIIRRNIKQIPDVRKTLDVVQHFETASQPFETTYEISSQLHAFAEVEHVDKVNLWLGANVMMEYSLDEAKDVLTKKEKAATEYLANLENHLEFLKDQLTTVEVNIARFHNLAVKNNQINQKPEVNAH